MSTITRRGILEFIAAMVVSVTLLGANSQAGAATIYACVKKHGGAARLVSKAAKCKKGESKISLSTRPVEKSGVPGAKGETGAKGEAGVKGEAGTSATSWWAAIEEDGDAARSSGLASAKHIGAEDDGEYELTFRRDISKCVYVATLREHTGFAVISGISGHTLRVHTFEEDGIEEDEPFYLAVLC